MSKTEHGECAATGKMLNESENVVCNVTTTEKIVGIYGLFCRTTCKWYIGQSVDVLKRWSRYALCDCRKQRKLYNALKKYGYDDFEKVILEKCDAVEWILDYREMYWIRYLNSFESGYNLTEGGSAGRKSEETKRKMSVWQIGKKHSEETKRKIGLKSLGRRFSAESNEKKGSGFRGKHRTFSDNHCKSISLGRMGIPSPFRGKTHTEDVRKKIGDRSRGTHLTAETKAKISMASKGKPKSEEIRRRMSECRIGVKRSKETLAKIAATREQNRIKKLQLNTLF